MGAEISLGDRRIRKSERVLKHAYERLLETRDPSEITVKDLCEAADVNRSTFYARFGYMEVLEGALIQDHMIKIFATEKGNVQFKYLEAGVLEADSIGRYLENFRKDKFIHHLLHCARPEKYREMILQVQVANTVPENSSLESKYAAYLQNGGVIVLVTKWIHDGCVMPVEQLTEIIQDASRGMFKHIK